MRSVVFVLLLIVRCKAVALLNKSVACSGYSVEPGTGVPIAYKYFPPGSVLPNVATPRWNFSRAFCSQQCLPSATGCQLAIARNTTTVPFLYKLVTDGETANAVSSPNARCNWLGLSRNGAYSNWTWFDGKICNSSNPKDERCYGRLVYSNNNNYSYAGILTGSSWSGYTSKQLLGVPSLEAYNQGSAICEIPISQCSQNACPYWTVPMNGSCQFCPLKSFPSSAIAFACDLNCSDGQSMNIFGSSTCFDCSPGQFSDESTLWDCTLCPSGKYQQYFGSSDCDECPPNSSTSIVGAVSPQNCNQACQWDWQSQQLECSLCPAGKYLATNHCVECPAGRYGPHEGATSVSQCGPCENGKFNPLAGQTSNTSCIPCPASAPFCLEGSGSIAVPPEFWFDGSALLSCLPPQACKGGTYTGPYDAIVKSNSLCNPAYAGELCVDCSQNHFRLAGFCEKCLPIALTAFLIAGSVVVGVVVMRHLAASKIEVPSKVKLCLFWFQILAMYPLIFQAWPPELLNAFNFFSLVNLDIGYLGFGCGLTNVFYKFMVAKLCFPLFFWVVMILVEYAISRNNLKLRILKCSAQCLFMVNFFSLQLFSTFFQIFNCVEVNGQRRLKAEPSQLCYTPMWISYVIIDVAFMFFYIIVIPVLILMARRDAKQKIDDNKFSVLISPLAKSYREGCEGFELYRLMFKLAFVVVRDAFEASRMTKAAFLAILLSIQNWIDSWHKPFLDKESNGLAMLWNQLAMLILVSQFVFDSDVVSVEAKKLFVVLFLVVIAGIFGFVFFTMIKARVARIYSTSTNDRIAVSELDPAEFTMRTTLSTRTIFDADKTRTLKF
eukprot:TRINITY_DN4201_c0_g1_i1.p1 TRINITY_DN4201_c0_g1~~TRINITY_DN4201_c0_g1_i1.p1  ORF type:complete len:847 (+),score=144.13 TRINITY_DN4201_c0_g1_i1:40-2541(+)